MWSDAASMVSRDRFGVAGLDPLAAISELHTHGVLLQLPIVHFIVFVGDIEIEVDHKEEFYFQRIDLFTIYAAHLTVIGVVEVLIIKKLGRQHDGGDNEAVDAERVYDQILVLIDQPIHINETQNEALLRASRIFGNTLQIVLDRDGGRAEGVELGHVRGVHRDVVVSFTELGQHASQHRDQFGAPLLVWFHVLRHFVGSGGTGAIWNTPKYTVGRTVALVARDASKGFNAGMA